MNLKRKLLKSVMLTIAGVLVGLSSVAGTQMRHENDRRHNRTSERREGKDGLQKIR